ncbi:DUF7107 domain-containing protein [Myxococcus qinghaiensis]|uniref:DUF7107 domain-containing protein n=1 Tax=Myxococcus qinghaiensis TaxID=2906758 RepID=UPI0020A7D631|nr:hypothetical protein [Myxococcus qinghaiensis]MCP3163560.1 hypothetical protein [Myxococcus qinghaiensis]
MRRLLPLSLLPVLVLLVAPGCPLDIRIRCDESQECSQGQVCVRGGCEPVDAERVGAACGADSDCGEGLSCGLGFPGGYCLFECSEAKDCPRGTVCATELGQCLRTCGEDCARSGYGCGAVPQAGEPLTACVPVMTSADGGCTGTACEVPDAGCTGSGCGVPDGGCKGTGCGTPDAGCSSTVAVGGPCSRACECADPAAACEDSKCTLTCVSDFACRDGRRCSNDACVVGPRLGDACTDSLDCPTFASCPRERMRCEEKCNWNAGGGLCEPGYQCAPDGLCVQACSGTPASVGEVCENSMDCSPCSVCLTSGAALRCRQPCRLDRDCPGGAVGACEQVGDTKACRLSL